jgi:hypothetical protein
MQELLITITITGICIEGSPTRTTSLFFLFPLEMFCLLQLPMHPGDDNDDYLYKLQRECVTKSILYTLPYRLAKKAKVQKNINVNKE